MSRFTDTLIRSTEAKPIEERRLTLTEVAERLNDPTIPKKPGRTLPPGHQWDGRDIPGRGKAAARRLRQMEKK